MGSTLTQAKVPKTYFSPVGTDNKPDPRVVAIVTCRLKRVFEILGLEYNSEANFSEAEVSPEEFATLLEMFSREFGNTSDAAKDLATLAAPALVPGSVANDGERFTHDIKPNDPVSEAVAVLSLSHVTDHVMDTGDARTAMSMFGDFANELSETWHNPN